MSERSWFTGLVLSAGCLAFSFFLPPAAHAADTTPPVGTIVINNNRSATNSSTVTLALTWSDGAAVCTTRARPVSLGQPLPFLKPS